MFAKCKVNQLTVGINQLTVGLGKLTVKKFIQKCLLWHLGIKKERLTYWVFKKERA